MILDLLGQRLELRPERALYWHEQKLLALSDLHLGKAESYQREGIPMPADQGVEDLTRLSHLIHELNPKSVLFVGDFIHARTSWSMGLKDELEGFFHVHRGREFHLIVGNHERGSLHHFEELPVQIVPDFAASPFLFVHGHEKQRQFSVEGHLHPAITIKQGPLRFRLPCFVLEENRLILPSFGEWTGAADVTKQKHNRVFAVSGPSVFEIPPRLS